MKRARWALIALALTGCGDAAQLADENRQLRKELQEAATALDERWVERQADLAYWRHEATIAAACDYLIPLCPESMTAPGHEAIANGAYGGGGAEFWWLVTLKFVAIGAGLSALWLSLEIGFLYLIAPRREALDDARATIARAERQADVAHARVREAERRLERIQEEIEQAQQEAREAEQQTQEAQEIARQERESLETLQQAREALAGL